MADNTVSIVRAKGIGAPQKSDLVAPLKGMTEKQ